MLSRPNRCHPCRYRRRRRSVRSRPPPPRPPRSVASLQPLPQRSAERPAARRCSSAHRRRRTSCAPAPRRARRRSARRATCRARPGPRQRQRRVEPARSAGPTVTRHALIARAADSRSSAGEHRVAPRQDVAVLDRRGQAEAADLLAHRARRPRGAVEAEPARCPAIRKAGSRLAGHLRGERAGALREAEAERWSWRRAAASPSPAIARAVSASALAQSACVPARSSPFGARCQRQRDGRVARRQRPGCAAAFCSTPPSVRAGRGAVDRAGEIDREGAVVAVEDHRAELALRASPIGADSVALVVERRPRYAIRRRSTCRPAGTRGQVEHAVAIDASTPAAPASRAVREQKVDDLRAGEVGERLREQRDRAGDLRRGEGRARPEIGRVVLVGRADLFADRGQIMRRAGARAVAEAWTMRVVRVPTEPAMITRLRAAGIAGDVGEGIGIGACRRCPRR